MNVLIISEDARHEHHILRPIVSRMFREIGKPHAKVRACMDPVLGGVSQALNWERLREIIEDNPFVQLFLLIVDRDGEEGRQDQLRRLEENARKVIKDGQAFFAENAWQETEVWALAGISTLPSNWEWRAIRQEIHPKEIYCHPYAKSRGLLEEPGQGRLTLGREAAAAYQRVRGRCPEDIQQLENRIQSWFQNETVRR